MIAGSGVPALACELAARLSELFTRDVEIVKRLNDAHRRLALANERLDAGFDRGMFGLVCGGGAVAAIGTGGIAALMRDGSAGSSGASRAVLEALGQIHSAIHGAFVDYQSASEERRQLAVDVGEFAQRLSDVLCAAGWSEHEARRVDVHELAGAGVG